MTVPPRILVVMGVSGSGKTTVAQALADRLGWPFQEGDALHPAENIAKMRAGHPLNDADRAPWLAIIARWVDDHVAAHSPGIITCSALKRSYRDQIVGHRPGVTLLYLEASRAALEDHVRKRRHEYMPPALLDSQLATLEAPGDDEQVIRVAVRETAEDTVAAAVTALSA